MRIPGALAALAWLAAMGLAPGGVQAQQITVKKDAATEVIDTISDVTRYDAALGDRPIDAAGPKKPSKEATGANKTENKPMKPADAGKKAETVKATAPKTPMKETTGAGKTENGPATPATAETGKKEETAKAATGTAKEAGKGSITPVKAGSTESPITVKEETARAIAEKRKVDVRSLEADGATAKPITSQPASMRINGIKPAVILPSEAANGHAATNGHSPTVLKAAQKAAESSGGKIIDVQRRPTRSKQRLPVVVRGVIPDDVEDTTPTVESLPASSGWRMTGGRNFWFYNRKEGLLIGCRLVGTAKVGDNKRIKCSRPRHAPDFH